MKKAEPKKELIAKLLSEGKVVYCRKTIDPYLMKFVQPTPNKIELYYFDNIVTCPSCQRPHNAPNNLVRWIEKCNTIEDEAFYNGRPLVLYRYLDFVGEKNIEVVSEVEKDIFTGPAWKNWLQSELDKHRVNQRELKIREEYLETLINKI